MIFDNIGVYLRFFSANKCVLWTFTNIMEALKGGVSKFTMPT